MGLGNMITERQDLPNGSENGEIKLPGWEACRAGTVQRVSREIPGPVRIG